MKNFKNMCVVLLAFAVLGLGACNTVRGIGQDVEEAGERVEDAAS